MYFVRIEPLKTILRDRTMTDRQALPYYVIFMACTALVCALPIAAETPTQWDFVSAATGTLLTIAGIIYSYVRNGGSVGFDFIQKSIVLGWVLIIRLLALIVFLAVAIMFLKRSLGLPLDETTWVDVLFVAAFNVIYYQRLGKHLKDTNTNGEPSPPPPRAPYGVHSEDGG